MKIIVNQYRNVALLVKQGSKYIHIVRITAHGLEAEKLTEEQLTEFWADLASYPVPEGVAKFRELGAKFGMSEAAKKLMDEALSEFHTGESVEKFYNECRAKSDSGVVWVGD